MNGLKLSFKNTISTLLLVFIFLIVAGCSQSGEAQENSAADENKEAIQTVIEKEFNGPDKKYRELWEAAMAFQTDEMDEEEYNAFQETPEYQELLNYMEETYAPYFTANAYETFSKTGAFAYSFSEKDYALKTDDLEITQSENEPTLYNFTFDVNYENESGETGVYSFEGNSIVPEKGKIGKIQFDDQDGLNQAIQK